MASIARDPGGRKRITFFDHHGKRRTLRLGKASMETARTVSAHVSALVTSKISGVVDDGTARWLVDRGDTFYAKLAKLGLVPPRATAQQTALGVFLDSYIRGRTDVKPGTATIYGMTKRCLLGYFTAARPIGSITMAECADFRRWLLRPKDKGGQGLAENTARRRCAIAKQFFADAVDRELLDRNPFRKMKGLSVGANRSRDYFVTRKEADAVLNACPDAQWRLLFALSRFGGLRCPSEHLAITWADVNWDRGTLRVRSPKTANHEGHDERTIPLWDELLPYLQAVWDEAPEGSQYVITRYRSTNQNLRTQLVRIIEKAGLTAWPKLFQNLRSTRATELLAATNDAQQVALWTGHSVNILLKHYAQMTQDREARAVAAVVKSSSMALAQQNTVAQNQPQSSPVLVRKDTDAPIVTFNISEENKALRYYTNIQMSPAGFEPTTYGLKVRCSTD